MMNEQTYGGARFGSSNCIWGGVSTADRSWCKYNEVVIDAPLYQSALPSVIDAFFFPSGVTVGTREGDEAQARHARDEFVRIYPHEQPPPLLVYDVARAREGKEPFSLALIAPPPPRPPCTWGGTCTPPPNPPHMAGGA